MPRSMTSGMAAALQASTLNPILLVELDLLPPASPIYATTGSGNLAWNSQTWVGAGQFLSISSIEEGTNVEARGISLSLSGIGTQFLPGILQELVQEMGVTVYLGLMDGFGNLIADPLVIWAGQSDQPTIELLADTVTISLAAESRLLEMGVPSDRRRTQNDQQLVAYGDIGLSFVQGCQECVISWGAIPSVTDYI